MKTTYRVTVKFVTIYTNEEYNKVEYSNDFRQALGAYIVYIENPETVFCTVDIVGRNNSCKKIVAAYKAP